MHVQAELICSDCFDLTLGSMEWVCQHLFVERNNSSVFHRGLSSSMSYSARDETTACSLAFFSVFLQLDHLGRLHPVFQSLCSPRRSHVRAAAPGMAAWLPCSLPSSTLPSPMALALKKKSLLQIKGIFLQYLYFLFCFCLTAMTASPHYYGKYRVGGNYYLSMNGSRSGHRLHWPFFDKV